MQFILKFPLNSEKYNIIRLSPKMGRCSDRTTSLFERVAHNILFQPLLFVKAKTSMIDLQCQKLYGSGGFIGNLKSLTIELW